MFQSPQVGDELFVRKDEIYKKNLEAKLNLSFSLKWVKFNLRKAYVIQVKPPFVFVDG